MKLDLWKCDRCKVTCETPPELGIPGGWIVLSFTKDKDQKSKDVHLCVGCNSAFYTWLKP